MGKSQNQKGDIIPTPCSFSRYFAMNEAEACLENEGTAARERQRCAGQVRHDGNTGHDADIGDRDATKELPPVEHPIAAVQLGHLLYEACCAGAADRVHALLAAGADCDMCLQRHAGRKDLKNRPLCGAASLGRLEVVRLLLEHKATVDAPNSAGTSPLMLAAMGGHVDVVRTLLTHRASIDAIDTSEWTALSLAALRGHVEAIRVLIEAGAHVDVFNFEGQTALSFACKNCHEGAARVLIQNGARQRTLCKWLERQLIQIHKSSCVLLVLALRNNAPTTDVPLTALNEELLLHILRPLTCAFTDPLAPDIRNADPLVPTCFMEWQRDVDQKMRTTLVGWLLKLRDTVSARPHTFFVAVR